MTRLMELERALDQDPLAMRLSGVTVAPISWNLRLALSGAVPPGATVGRRRRWAAAAAVAMVAVSLILSVTPAGAALARAVLPSGLQQFFGIVSGAPTQLSPPGGAVAPRGPARPLECAQAVGLQSNGVMCLPDLSLADAQRQVDFTIPTPSMLPGGLIFRGALVGSPRSVFFSYRLENGASGGLGLWVKEDPPVGGPTVPAGSIQAAKVNGSPAYYVHGDYEDDGPGTVARWNPNADAYELTWRHNGVTFDLTAGTLHLSEADFIQIAESVH